MAASLCMYAHSNMLWMRFDHPKVARVVHWMEWRLRRLNSLIPELRARQCWISNSRCKCK